MIIKILPLLCIVFRNVILEIIRGSPKSYDWLPMPLLGTIPFTVSTFILIISKHIGGSKHTRGDKGHRSKNEYIL